MIRTGLTTLLLLPAIAPATASAAPEREPLNTVAPGAVLTKLNPGNHNQAPLGGWSPPPGWQDGVAYPDGGSIMLGQDTSKRGEPYILARYDKYGQPVRSFGNNGRVEAALTPGMRTDRELVDNFPPYPQAELREAFRPIVLPDGRIQFGQTQTDPNGSPIRLAGKGGRADAPVLAIGSDGTMWGLARERIESKRPEEFLVRLDPSGRSLGRVTSIPPGPGVRTVTPGQGGSVYIETGFGELVQLNSHGRIMMRADLPEDAADLQVAPNPDGGVDVLFQQDIDAIINNPFAEEVGNHIFYVGPDGEVDWKRSIALYLLRSSEVEHLFRLADGRLLTTAEVVGNRTTKIRVKMFTSKNKQVFSGALTPPFAGGYASTLDSRRRRATLAQTPGMGKYFGFCVRSKPGIRNTIVHPDGGLMVFGAAAAKGTAPLSKSVRDTSCGAAGRKGGDVLAARGAMAKYKADLTLDRRFGGDAAPAALGLVARDQNVRSRKGRRKPGGIRVRTRTYRPGLVRVTARSRGQLIARFIDISYGTRQQVTDVRLTPGGRKLLGRAGRHPVTIEARFRDLLGTYSETRTTRIRVRAKAVANSTK